MRRTLVALTIGATFVAMAGCSKDTKKTAAQASPSPTSVGAQTFKVMVDGHTPDNQLAFTAFFPQELSVHPGDTVDFGIKYSGEPHTVALGTQVTTALDKIDALLKANPKALDNGPPPAELQAIPQLLPQGPGDAIQAGAQPCVVEAAGTIPKSAACTTQTLAAFDGTQKLDSSGWMAADSHFSVTFAPTTKPGKYRFMCQLHGPGMTGAVTVVDPTSTIKDPAAVEAQGTSEREALLPKLKPGFDMLAKATAAAAFAGSGVDSVDNALITAFGPKDIKIPVGGSVSWTVLGPHVVAFNAPADAQGARVAGDGTAVHLSQKAVAAAGGVGIDPAAQQPPPLIDGGIWNGVGFRSSGLIIGSPPPHATVFKLAFSKAGTYSFMCTIHEDMKGTVTVG